MEDSVVLSVDTFKICTKCAKNWKNRESFLDDPDVVLAGYQVNFRELKAGLFLFNHLECETTISINAEHFIDMYSGPMFEERLLGTKNCSENCLHEDNLQPCPAKCECAYVRDVIHKIDKNSNPG